MNWLTKLLFFFLLVQLVFISPILITPISAQYSPKPSIPQFSLKLISSEYTVPPSYSIDPYTGENITHSGYNVRNQSVEISIKNQHLVLTLENASLYYNVRVKGHFENASWSELYSYDSSSPGVIVSSGTLPPESNSQYTVLYYPVNGFANNTQLDFQVEAFIGDYSTSEPSSHSPFVPSSTTFGILSDTETGWSETKTILLVDNSPTTTPPVPELSPLAVLALLLLMPLIAVILKNKKASMAGFRVETNRKEGQ
jgi:hypothetical protein